MIFTCVSGASEPSEVSSCGGDVNLGGELSTMNPSDVASENEPEWVQSIME